MSFDQDAVDEVLRIVQPQIERLRGLATRHPAKFVIHYDDGSVDTFGLTSDPTPTGGPTQPISPPRSEYHFTDDFESYNSTSDIIADPPGNWKQFQNTDKANNVIELSTDHARSGTQSVRFFKPLMESSKAGLIKGDDEGAEPFSFSAGDIVSMVMHYYIPDGPTNPWPGANGDIKGPRLWDMEGSEVGDNQGGIRIGWNARDTSVPRLDRNKIDLPNINADIKKPWPRDEWFKLEMRVKLGQLSHNGYDRFYASAPAWLQWIVDFNDGVGDTIILQRSCTTIPSGEVYNRLTVGPTISLRSAEVYLDDVEVRMVDAPLIAPG